MNEVDACRAVLIEVLTILAKDLDKLAVVGGWVQELTCRWNASPHSRTGGMEGPWRGFGIHFPAGCRR
jgi:hypothetical protein